MKKLLILAGAVLALASCTNEVAPDPYYLDGEYVVDFWSYEDNGPFFDGGHVFIEDLCIVKFSGDTMTTYKYNPSHVRKEEAVPVLGHIYEQATQFDVTYVEGGVLIEGEFWAVAEGNAFLAREFEMGAVYQLHKMMLNEI